MACIMLAFTALFQAQDRLAEMKARAAVRPPLKREAVSDDLERRVRALRDRAQHPTTQREVEGRRGELRKRLNQSLGYNLLPWPPDLRTTVSGIIQGGRYHIEKIIFQSLQNVMITAHVYVPDGLQRPAPAVLFTNGHAGRQGKALADTQAFCINMARLGFIVLNADAIGEGERGAESKHHHVEALLVGLSEPGILEYETQCALEYLRLRKDVDASRIGMTGVHGGGFNTWITAALDERIEAAVPVEDTFDLFELIHRMRVVNWNEADDHCQLVPGILRYANIQELIAMVAPRALMMIGGADFREIYDYAQRLYQNFGVSGKISRFESDGVGYGKQRREAAYGFFLRALMNRGDGSPIVESQVDIRSPDSTELQCLPKGHQASAEPGIAEAVLSLARATVSLGMTVSPETLAGEPPERGSPHTAISTFPVQRENIAVPKDIELPITILRPGFGPYPAGGRGGVLVALDDKDKETLVSDPVVQEALRRDWLVFAFDPRGFGELAVEKPGWVFATSLLLGENFIWRQAWDLRLLLDLEEGWINSPFALYARGRNASLVATYALSINTSDDKLKWVLLREGFSSLKQFFQYPSMLKAPPDDQSIPYGFFAFGALRSLDIPQLLSRAKTRAFIIDPVDAQPAAAAQSYNVRLTTIEEFTTSDW